MYIKSRVSAQKENIQKPAPQEQVVSNQGIQFFVNVGDQKKCPECQTVGRVVWVSQDKKRMGVQCPASHREPIKPISKFGANAVPSTRNRRNAVFLTAVA